MSNGVASIGGNSGKKKTPGAFGKKTSSKGLTKNLGDLTLQPSKPAETPQPRPLGIIVTGDKDVGKSTGPAGLPRPNGGKTYFLTFDDATMAGLTNYYTEKELEDIVVIELTRKQFNDDGDEVYPGYDPNKPETAEVVCGTAMAWLEEIENAGDCDNLVVDHFQTLRSDVAQSYTISHHGLDPLAQLKPQHYNLRTRVCKMIEAKARVIPRHAIVLTGYGDEEKLLSRRTPEGNTEWYTGIKKPRWVNDYMRPYHVHINHTSTASMESDLPYEETTDEVTYWYHVVTSKYSLFPKGARYNATGSSYQLFWDKEEATERLMDEIETEVLESGY